MTTAPRRAGCRTAPGPADPALTVAGSDLGRRGAPALSRTLPDPASAGLCRARRLETGPNSSRPVECAGVPVRAHGVDSVEAASGTDRAARVSDEAGRRLCGLACWPLQALDEHTPRAGCLAVEHGD